MYVLLKVTNQSESELKELLADIMKITLQEKTRIQSFTTNSAQIYSYASSNEYTRCMDSSGKWEN